MTAMRDSSLPAWLRLARCRGLGPVQSRRLLARLGGPERVLAALPGMIERGLPGTVEIATAEAVAAELEATARQGLRLLPLDDPDYPPALAEIADAPLLVTVAGDAGLLAAPAVALVGARNASGNGCRMAERMAAELAEAGLVVVSGLARGIDTAVHEGALSVGGGTVAVIASGVDIAYPPENAGLMARITASGAVVGERPLGAAPRAKDFPRRNRLISGLALGTVVIEAAPRSGSLITAEMAAAQGREVMAVPGTPLDPRHRGTNQLLKEGAQLVESAADVLAILRPLIGRPLPTPRARPPAQASSEPTARPATRRRTVAGPIQPDLDPLAVEICRRLGGEPMTMDQLVRDCGGDARAVQSALAALELEGRVERQPGNRVARRLD